jgi:hypothetical protein
MSPSVLAGDELMVRLDCRKLRPRFPQRTEHNPRSPRNPDRFSILPRWCLELDALADDLSTLVGHLVEPYRRGARLTASSLRQAERGREAGDELDG